MGTMSQRVANYGTTIFSKMTALARQYEAVNLGQGFPDFAAPDFLKRAAQEAIAADVNQYAPSAGQPALREAIARKVARDYGLTADPLHEVTVMNGATEAVFSAVLGLVDPGDEVILFEPYFDIYLPAITFAGGVPRYYTLRPPDWGIDRQQLEALFSERTKLIILNTPHNPTGKVYSDEELGWIAGLCRMYDVIAVTDEVYEHMVYDGRSHRLLATYPGMNGRTVTISSLGKTFSVTGWKVGWAIAAPHLSDAVRRVRQYTTFCGAAPLQEAAAVALDSGPDYYQELAATYQARRDFLFQALEEAGLRPILPQGTYFIMAQIDHLDFVDDFAFCRYLTTEVGVAAIPPGAFYQHPSDGAGLARFAFCKSTAALETAARRLKKGFG